MKIGFFVRNFSGGGAELVAVTLANEMARMGHEVFFFVISSDGPHREKLSNRVHLIVLSANRLLLSVLSLRRSIIESCIEVLYSNMTHENIVALLSVRNKEVKIVAIEHNNFFQEMRRRGKITYLVTSILVNFLYPKADALVCVSNGVANEFRRRFKKRIGVIKTIYNPVLIARSESSISINRPYIVSAGRLTTQKNFSFLIRAYNELIKNYGYRGELVILGQGPKRKELEELVEKLCIQDRVHFLGFVPDTTTYFKNADCFVLSSLWEGFGNVLVEAMQSGCKVVATNCEFGPSEILCDGKYGRLVSVFDVDELAKAINSEINSPREVESIISRGLDFEPSRIVDQYLEVLS